MTRTTELPDLPNMDKDEQFSFLATNPPANIRQFMAGNPYTDPVVVDYLVGDPSPDVRATVANLQDAGTTRRNGRLIRDRSPVVTQSLACNPLTASYHLMDLARDSKDTLTLLYIRENPNTPEDVRDRLYRDL